jgi:hypothetical protein
MFRFSSTVSHLDVKREVPIGSAPAEKVGNIDHGLSGALSIGRFVVSRWYVSGGRGPMGIQSSVGVLYLAFGEESEMKLEC